MYSSLIIGPITILFPMKAFGQVHSESYSILEGAQMTSRQLETGMQLHLKNCNLWHVGIVSALKR